MEGSNSNMACDHIKPCNISQSKRHNRRDADYIASLNPKMLYIRQELTSRNESYVAPDVEGKSLEEIYNDIKAMVKLKTGRRMQERQQEYTDKRGRKKVRNGSSPLRESVVRMKPDTTMDDLQKYVQQVQQRWGIRAIQIHIHRDEGHYINPDNPKSWVPNLHAHIIWDWMNHETGKSCKLGKKDMEELQDLAAETLEMERGRRKADTGAEHLERNDYILHKQEKELEQLKEQTEELTSEKEAVEKEIRAAYDEQALAKAEVGFAQESLADIRRESAEEKQRLDDEYDEKKKALDDELTEKRNESSLLSVNIQKKKNEGATLDKHNEAKRKTSTNLEAEIDEKREQAEKLKKQVEQSIKENYAIKQREDWQIPMFTGMAKYLYETDEQLRFCVDAIADFARSGAGCRGGNHGAIFFDEEASAIKNFIARVAEIAAARLCRLPKARTTIKDVAQWLVWVAKEIGKLTDMELHRADSEVNDVVDGKYDWRIEKLDNHNGLTR